MKKFSLLTILCLTLIFTSCGTLFTPGGSDYRAGVSQYKSKNYVTSLESLNSALVKNPEFIEASALFPVVFNEGTQYYKNIVSENMAKETPDEADKVYHAYQDLQSLHKIAIKSGRDGLNTEDFTIQVKDSLNRACELRFKYAESLEATGNRENIKKAVSQYETVKLNDSSFPDIDNRIEQAISKANVTLMILGSGQTSDFHNQINVFLKNHLAQNRYVTVVDAKEFQNQLTNSDSAIAWGKEHNIDYVLTVKETKAFEKIMNQEDVKLPFSTPIFDGHKAEYGYSILCKLDYNLIKLNPSAKIIQHEVITSSYTSPLFTHFYVGSDGMDELNIGDTGTQTYRYTSSNASSEVLLKAMSDLSADYFNIPVPATITDATKQSEWIDYYESKYSSLKSLVENESGDSLFYGTELVHDTNSDLYYYLGASPIETIQKQRVDSAIMNARVRVALNLIDSEKENMYDDIDSDTAKQLEKVLQKIF